MWLNAILAVTRGVADESANLCPIIGFYRPAKSRVLIIKYAQKVFLRYPMWFGDDL